jgi:hypothetical protein
MWTNDAKRRYLIALLTGVVLFAVAGGVLLFVVKRPYPPINSGYVDSNALVSDINLLPDIADAADASVASDWGGYATVAKRMRLSDPEIVKSSLRAAAGQGHRRRANAKVMILLRVCFECPAGRVMPEGRGGWVSATGEATATIKDMNWPVASRMGQFYLRNTLDGYMGPIYDPIAEFDWMQANCKWRD